MRSVVLATVVIGCGPKAGEEDSEILVPFDQLTGGVVFATRAIPGSNGYDLWWAPVPLAGSAERQPVLRLTEAGGDEWQPSVSPGGRSLAFAKKDNGIFLVTESGRIKRISDTRSTKFKDSLPAVSYDGVRVAWVREDYSRPIGDSGFAETFIMIATFEGEDVHAVNPREMSIQDAPVFDPTPRSDQLAWSEFSVRTLTNAGPQDYGIWVHDMRANTGRFVCNSPTVIQSIEFRCFGQHLEWPITNVVVLPQNFLEVSLIGDDPTTIYTQVLDSVNTQQIGVPETTPAFPGFHRPFPISASYDGVSRLIFDGLVGSVEGDLPTLAFFVSQVDGGGIWRLMLEGHTFDFDNVNTADYFFSVATPQLIPEPPP
jgi:hypothetical protein